MEQRSRATIKPEWQPCRGHLRKNFSHAWPWVRDECNTQRRSIAIAIQSIGTASSLHTFPARYRMRAKSNWMDTGRASHTDRTSNSEQPRERHMDQGNRCHAYGLDAIDTPFLHRRYNTNHRVGYGQGLARAQTMLWPATHNQWVQPCLADQQRHSLPQPKQQRHF